MFKDDEMRKKWHRRKQQKEFFLLKCPTCKYLLRFFHSFSHSFFLHFSFRAFSMVLKQRMFVWPLGCLFLTYFCFIYDLLLRSIILMLAVRINCSIANCKWPPLLSLSLLLSHSSSLCFFAFMCQRVQIFANSKPTGCCKCTKCSKRKCERQNRNGIFAKYDNCVYGLSLSWMYWSFSAELLP